MKTINWMAAIVFGTAGCLHAQELLSPEKAVEIALKNNYSILIAHNDQQSSDASVTRGNAGMLPRVDIAAGASAQNTNINQRFSNGISVATTGVNNTATNASAVLSWTLFDGGKMFVVWDRLKEQKVQSQFQLRDLMEQSISSVLDAYFLIVRLKQEVRAREFAVTAAEEQLSLTKKKVELGSSSRQEYLQVTVDRNTAVSQLKTQQIALANAQTQLNQLMGIALDQSYDFPTELKSRFAPQLEEIRQQASSQNASLLLAKSNQSINLFRLREVKAERMPILKLATGYNYARSSSTAGFALFNQSNGLNGGLTFSWNLFNGGQLKTRMMQAQLAIENDAIKIRQTESQVNASIQIAIRQWEQASELLKLEEENFLSARENVSLALERLRLGNAGILVVKEAQRSYEEAISRQSAAALLAKQAEIELMRLAGKLVR
ncbi:MAG: hypothetical protein RLZZ543_1326 [Bacteroidota bacterium]|jgi:outer membrane protein TolC